MEKAKFIQIAVAAAGQKPVEVYAVDNQGRVWGCRPDINDNWYELLPHPESKEENEDGA